MFLGPVNCPAKIYCTALVALQHGKFSRLEVTYLQTPLTVIPVQSKTIHKKNLQILMTEVYRTINHLNPEYMWEFFTKRDVPYGLRISELCKIPSVNTLCYGINSLSFRGSLLWNALSDEIKLTASAKVLKKKYDTEMTKIVRATSAHRKFFLLVLLVLNCLF